MDQSVVHDVHMAINVVHRLVYFVPEAAEEYAAFGIKGQAGYFASRSAPMGAVTDSVVLATFYNFSPLAVTSAMPRVWEAASPDEWQAARFSVVKSALDRVQPDLSTDQIEEARSLIDPVVRSLQHGGKPLAASNAAVALPTDPLVALWQQVTVVREWRGDVHVALLVTNQLAPSECLVLQVASGRFPLLMAQRTRRWTDAEWAAATASLADRGWMDADGTMTPAGLEERERLEDETDRLCAPMWEAIGDKGTARLTELIMPIHEAMQTAGTYTMLA